ncbi:hypothetical protein N0B31_00190 [Salinirubellus salinus]|uniref:Uncharacterized protein n=1 Tax=Salinirubellus salinus TaxID=1364945 RepID=A0A9E7R4W5_9EURY|nr:hypothetical protein [Salinirubellus salinus]UWM54643.1 hypothetical protein N0B31_21300 [Salinirubellus salinus]UWM54715.1 hypothetical protein N0B31_00190 [Salinirubellus salinus]
MSRSSEGETRGVRYGTVVEDGEVYVQTDDGLLWVAGMDDVVAAVGGPAWTISYSDWERERYDLDTSDEGLTVSVVDMAAAMEHGGRFVETLAAMPATTRDGDLSPRAGLFVGKLLENLQSGVA